MSIGTIYGKDSLAIKVSITDEETSALMNLSGATVEAYAKKSGGETIAATTEIIDAANGLVGVSFTAGTFENLIGSYTMHVRTTKAGEVQTVAVILFTVQAAL